ncbi:MAG: diguanylate cyclase [Lachnospiraceae bacterium]|nr:diguanylate cyclase [Lachnospiraceae bacterium]
MEKDKLISQNKVAAFILEINEPYRILDFDQGLCLMSEYTPRELSGGVTTLDKLFKEDFDKIISSINYQLSISNMINFQSKLKTKTGKMVTTLCSGQTFSLNDGREVIQCILTDITNLETAASQTQQAKTDLEIFANTVPSGVSKHLLDNNLSLIWANNYFFNMCGYTERTYKEKYGRNTLSIILSQDLATVIDALADLTEDKQSTIVNYRIKCANDEIRWVNAVFARAGEKAEGFPVVNIVMSDITNLKIAEMKAAVEEQKYHIISDISEELPYEYDIATDTIKFADKFNHIFEGKSIIQNPADNMTKSGLVAYESKDTVRELFSLAKMGTEYHSTEFKLNTKNGGYQWYFSVFSTIYDDEEKPIRVIGLLRNIHAQKLEQQNLIEKAETDLMTGLLNKVTTENRIKTSLRDLDGNSNDVLMLVDIDDFKNINDTYGHLMGDEVIISIANTLKRYSGDYGFAGRLGGDEFCLYLSNILDMNVAFEKAKFILSDISKLYPGSANSPKVTLSIGISPTNEQIPLDTLIEHADTALYQVKLSGKNSYYCYQEDMVRVQYKNDRRKNEDNNLINEVLSTLFTNSNTYSSIEKALNLIGTAYEIDKISIFEYGFDKNFVDCTHQWCADGVANDMAKKQHTPAAIFEELNAMGTSGITYFSDTSVIKLNFPNLNPYYEGVRKLIQSEIRLNGKIIGFIAFYSMSTKTDWSSDKISGFNILFKILAEAICTKQAQNTLSFLREDTIQIFNIVQTPMIIIDKDTYDIVYCNDISHEYYPNIAIGAKCYRCISDESSPCSDCPLYKNNKTSYISRYNKYIKDNVDIYYTPVKWNIGSNTFVMSVSPHSALALGDGG